MAEELIVLGTGNAMVTKCYNTCFVMKDENCFCSDCQRRFRGWLKKVYGTLDKVNRSYKSRYKSSETA